MVRGQGVVHLRFILTAIKTSLFKKQSIFTRQNFHVEHPPLVEMTNLYDNITF